MEYTSTEKLIEAVKEHPMLYDLNHENYRNKIVSNKKWKEIGELMDISGEVAKKKWKGLRDSYTKHVRAIRSTGHVASVLNRYKSWPWAEHMSFLRPFMDATQTDSSNLPQIDISNDVEDIVKRVSSPPVAMYSSDFLPVIETFSINKQKIKHKKRRGFPGIYNYNTRSNSEFRVNSEIHSSERVPEIDDDIDLMFKSFAKTVKSFSPKRKIIFKGKLAKLVTEEELAHLNELPVKCSACSLSLNDHWTANNPGMTSEKTFLDSAQNINDSDEAKAVHFLCSND